MEFLFIATMLLGFITVVGHGIWVLIAAFIRLVSGRPKNHEDVFSTLERLLRDGVIDVDTHRRMVLALSKQNDYAANDRPIQVDHQSDLPTEPDEPAEATEGRSPFQLELPLESAADEVVGEVVVAEVVEEPTAPEPPHVPKPIHDRAREYVARRQAAQRETADVAKGSSSSSVRAEVASPARELRRPRRTMGEWLAAFLEESNIRWGELVGGLLIVSCSTALVISFWSEISARPLLKFGVFNGVIAALFLLGIHAAKKWNLPSTSQGVLLIAMLLVPLNFLAIAAFTKDTHPDTTTFVGELISIGTFATLGYLAAQILTPRWPLGTVFGVVGLSIFQLLVRRWVGPDSSVGSVRVMAGVISAIYFASHLPTTLYLRRHDTDEDDETHPSMDSRLVASQCWKLLGTVSFAALLCIAFLVVQSERSGDALQNVSLFGGLLAAPGMAIAALLLKRIHRSGEGLTAVASIAVGIGSVLLLVAMVVFAWPQPVFISVSSAVAFVACTWVSIESRQSHGHYVAAGFLGILAVLLGHIVLGTVSWRVDDVSEMMRLFTSVHNGKHLVAAAGIAFAGSHLFGVIRRPDDQSIYLRISAIFASAACVLAMVLGFGRQQDPAGVIWIAGTMSVGFLWIALQLQRPVLVGSAAVLLLIASLQWLTFGFPVFENWIDRIVMSLLLIGSVFGLIKTIPRRIVGLSGPVSFAWRGVILASVVSVGLLLVARILWSVNSAPPAVFVWFAAVSLVAAIVERNRFLFATSEIATLASGVLSLHRWQVGREIVGSGLGDWLQPASYHWQTILLASFSVLFIAIRVLIDRLDHDGKRGNRDVVAGSVASAFAVLAIFLTAASAVYTVAPGIGQELSLVQDSAAARTVPDIASFYLLNIAHGANEFLPWLTWGVVVAVALVSIRFDRRAYDEFRAPIVCLALLGISPCLMAAHFFESDVSVASAVRWTTAGFFVVGCLVIWTAKRWRPVARSFGFELTDLSERGRFAFGVVLAMSILPMAGMLASVMLAALTYRQPTAEEFIGMTVAGGAAVILTAIALTTQKSAASSLNRVLAVGAGMSGIFFVAALVVVVSKTLVLHPVVGPNPESVFRRIGLAGSYVSPMILFAVGFIGTAHHFRSQPLAFAASILCNVCATASVLFLRAGSLDEQQWIQLSLINSIVASVAVLVWAWWRKGDAISAAELSTLRSNQTTDLLRVAFGISCSFLGLAAAGIGMVLFLDVIPAADVDCVGVLGLVALLLVTITKLRLDTQSLSQLSPTSRLLFSTAAVAFIAVFLFDGRSNTAYQLLLAGMLAAPIGSILNRGKPQLDLARSNRTWQALCFAWILASCAYSLRTLFGASFSDAWSYGGIAAAAVVSSVVAAVSGRMRFAYIAAVLFNLSASVWFALSSNSGSVPDFVRVNLIALALPVVWWSLALWRMPNDALPQARIQRYIRFIAVSCCLVTAMISILMFGGGLVAGPLKSSGPIAWLGVGACLLAVVSSAVARAGLRVGTLSYVLGLSAAGVFLETLKLSSDDLVWSSCLVLSAFGLIANYLASRQNKLKAALQRFVFPEGQSSLNQLPPIQFGQRLDLVSSAAIVVALLVVGLGFATQFTSPSQPIRLVASQAILAQVFAVGLLPVARWSSARYFALLLAEFGVVAFGWSSLPHDAARSLDRIVIAAVGTAVVTFVYAVGLIKLTRKENAWTQSAIQLVPWLAGLIVTLISAVLVVEGVAFTGNQTVIISNGSIAAVAGTLLAVAIACLAFAIWPGRDPLSLEREQLGRYVFAAELVLAMLFAHLRMSMPWLFEGIFEQVWPLVVMAIAFTGVGFAELTKRLERDELSVPLERTGAFLPMLPAIGMWIVPSEISFSLLMLVVCVLYAMLASMRRSFGFSVLAVLSGNAGLWHLLQEQGISILDHPQIWLIPPALCVLVSASLNRKRLTESQNVAIRYASASVIYVSSTADIFINGVANAPWLPLVLAGLSLAGIFVGIMLRVRTFLFLGISFLMVSMLTVVWHAAVDLQQTWIWYVSGIVTGIMILIVFAVFEKKRQAVLGTLERFKEWEA